MGVAGEQCDKAWVSYLWIVSAGVGSVLAVACERANPAADQLARERARARASANAARSAAPPAPTPPAPPPPPLVEEAFRREKPPSLCAPEKTAVCALDAVADVPTSDVTAFGRTKPVKLVGWAADRKTGTVPPVVIVELASKAKNFYAPATRITKRPDVAAAEKVPAFVGSGYDLLASFKTVDPGEYAVNVLQVDANGKALSCETRRKFKIQ